MFFLIINALNLKTFLMLLFSRFLYLVYLRLADITLSNPKQIFPQRHSNKISTGKSLEL